ncbi:MAG: hypothetical protein RLY16_1291 [Bacteroidota bacterium]
MALLLLLSSCATYNQRITAYHQALKKENYSKANEMLDGIRLLQKNRNRLLYVMEKGKTLHLLKMYDSSNHYLNEADDLIELARTSAKDAAVTYLVNPMLQKYRPEDFEKYLIHYYKALNYIFLGNTESALVEVRKISLVTQAQQDKAGFRTNRFEADAFSIILQGLLYEKANDINNAFIAYRNAADLFIKNNKRYYGVVIPDQLKQDLLRTAYLMGFTDELQRYEKIFKQTYTPQPKPAGELVVFWESGIGPVKDETMLSFNLVRSGNGYYFSDNGGLYNIPYDNYPSNNSDLSSLSMFALALPKYNSFIPQAYGATVQAPSGKFDLQKVADINVLATQTLQERFSRELGTALSRMVLKKLSEKALEPKPSTYDPNKTAEQRKKEKDQRTKQEILALGLKIFNRATEKADTRNWQSLPALIYYARIPLVEGENQLVFQSLPGNSFNQPVTIHVTANGSLQFFSVQQFH